MKIFIKPQNPNPTRNSVLKKENEISIYLKTTVLESPKSIRWRLGRKE